MENRAKRFSIRRIRGPLSLGSTLVIFGFCLLASPADMQLSGPWSTTNTNIDKFSSNVCYTYLCNETAKAMLKSIDKKMNPCQNFYKYAVGKNFNTTAIKIGLSVLNNFTFPQSKIEKQLNRSLSGTKKKKNKSKSYELVRNYYKICMESDKNTTDEIERIVTMMKSMGGWPVLEGDTWSDTNFDIWTATNKLSHFGYKTNQFVNFSLLLSKNNPNHSLAISPASHILSSKDMLGGKGSKSVVQAYLNYMRNIAEEFGAKGNHITNDLSQVLIFQQQLLYMSESCKLDGEKMNPMHINTIHTEFSGVPWFDLMKHHLPVSLTINDDDVIYIICTKYHQRLNSLLTWTPSRTIANYIMWSVALESAEFLNSKIIRDYRDAFAKGRGFMVQPREMWHECVTAASKLNRAIGSIYFREHFHRESQKQMVEMTKRLKEKLTSMLQQVSWLDPLTKKHILTKLKSMSSHIGFPEELLNDKEHDKYYHGLVLSPNNSYLESTLKIHKFNRDKQYEKLRKPLNENLWVDFNVQQIEVQYMSQLNTLYVWAGALEDILFNKNQPAYINYAALGMLIAHEMLHQLDPSFIYFDKDGNTVQSLSNSTKAEYYKRAKCIEDQYFKYTIKTMKFYVPTREIKSEIWANIKGMQLTYAAYDQWVEEKGEEQRLPGLEESPRQLFWLSFANSMFKKYIKYSQTSNISISAINEMYYSNERWINGILLAIPEFGIDYNCMRDMDLNPMRRCDIS